MTQGATPLDFILVGGESLLIHCASELLARGHTVRLIASNDSAVQKFAEQRGLSAVALDEDLPRRVRDLQCDVLLSVANRRILPAQVLRIARRAAVNFHDGPLPRHSGLNAPNWAILAGEREHGVTWHLMTERADAGHIIVSRTFPLADSETALTLNARCFEAGIDSFAELVDALESGRLALSVQPLDEATRHRRQDIPHGTAVVSWRRSAHELDALSRALDFGAYLNPIALPKIAVDGQPIIARHIRAAGGRRVGEPGEVLEVGDDYLIVACGDGSVRVGGLQDASLRPLSPRSLVSGSPAEKTVLADLDTNVQSRLESLYGLLKTGEEHWTHRLQTLRYPALNISDAATGGTEERVQRVTLRIPGGFSESCSGKTADASSCMVAAFVAFLLRRGAHVSPYFDIAFLDSRRRGDSNALYPWASAWVPLRMTAASAVTADAVLAQVHAECAAAERMGSFSFDLPARVPGGAAFFTGDGDTFPVAVQVCDHEKQLHHFSGALLTFGISGERCALAYDSARIPEASIARFAARFVTFLERLAGNWGTPASAISLLSHDEQARVTSMAAATRREVDPGATVHRVISARALASANSTAVVASDASLSYEELESRSNRLARFLQGAGAKPGDLVAILLNRTSSLPVALLGVLKAGCAYVPIDASHPRERIEMILQDSGAGIIITSRSLVATLPALRAQPVILETLEQQPATGESTAPATHITSRDLAYVIFTSGSTGRPKGVMVEHRNVVNLFAAMDEVVPGEHAVWLAVTGITFDISVLELLWTLSRGFTVVLHDERQHVNSLQGGAASGVDFSLFYFSADAGNAASERYKLLLEGAKFADANGFSAVWTPERHFHEFGGLYPNPAVTASAVAAITSRIGIRAGSVVLPLHHPIRVAEDWAIVDNISQGRVSISFASGWQPNDFVIRPESYEDNKKKMFTELDTVARLWRGETVSFPGPLGKPVEVRTLPRPVQPELPTWLTIAGNPDSYRTAGEKGMRVLTHLLGQSIDELAQKIAAYRAAWKEAGHAGNGYVALMLHTFVSDEEVSVRDIVRAPLKEYLRTSVGLIRDYAATFPALKKHASGQMPDFRTLSRDEMDALLDYSFERYYETSGLFGSPEKCAPLVQRLSELGVDEIACLIDFGVDPDTVLANLPALSRLREMFANNAGSAMEAHVPSAAELMHKHGVTHMQCTPSLARMLMADESARAALGRLRVLLVGGEAFPPRLAAELSSVMSGDLLNMYGPTETTVWSTVQRVSPAETDTAVPIGRPIANTRTYVVADSGELAENGAAGELWIGGAGVARGYLNQPALTAERFIPDPFLGKEDERVYRTGDVVSLNADGELEFHGRMDDQVKIRGHRIELGEIEAAIESYPGIRECAVVASRNGHDDARLDAYLAAVTSVDESALRRHLRERLPDVMLPARIVMVEALPRNTNGKIDRRALREARPAASAAVPERAVATPASELEERIASVWSDALGVTAVGVQDNFFDIGGHSLLAVQVHARLRREIAPDLSITDLFRYSTVRSLAAHIAASAEGMADEGNTVATGRERASARREALRKRQQRLS